MDDELNFSDVSVINNNKFVAPIRTIPFEKNWRCANVPYEILSNDGTNVKLRPFTSKKTIEISNEELQNEFYYLKNDDEYIYISGYPNNKVPISEFNVKQISTKKLEKYFEDENIITAINKVINDSFNSKGNQSTCTIKKYNMYKTENLENENNKLERFGDPIFNRSVRHSPPIPKTFTREEFEKSPSYPAPIGIREEDFAFPSEQNEILIELLNQLFSCKNAPECPEEIMNELGLNITVNSHLCLWCGQEIDISNLNQKYCSKEHTINFCHRIPQYGTKKGNVYIGHCSCNREQGGYSEIQRIEQIIRLAKNNPTYRQTILQELQEN